MFKKIFISFIFSFYSVILFAQNFEQIDTDAKKLNYFKSFTVRALCSNLLEPYKSKEEKLRAIYAWIGQRIKYDVKNFRKHNIKNRSVTSVVFGRKANADEIISLFIEMCKYASIKAYQIRGYEKGSWHFQIKEEYTYDQSSWVIVELDEQYFIVDIIPALGQLYSKTPNWQKFVSLFSNKALIPSKQFFKREYSYEYFLVEEKQQIKYKMPCNPIWQMLTESQTLKQFEKDSINNYSLKKIETFDAQKNLIQQEPIKYYLSEANYSKKFNSKDNYISLFYYSLAYTELTKNKKNFDLNLAIDFSQNIVNFTNLSRADINKKQNEYTAIINSKYATAKTYSTKRVNFISTKIQQSKRAYFNYNNQLNAISNQHKNKSASISKQKSQDISTTNKPLKNILIGQDTLKVNDIKQKLIDNFEKIKLLETEESKLIDSINLIENKIWNSGVDLMNLYRQYDLSHQKDFLPFSNSKVGEIDDNSTKIINKINVTADSIIYLENVTLNSFLTNKERIANQFVAIHSLNQAYLKQLKSISVKEHNEDEEFAKSMSEKIKNQEKSLEKLLFQYDFKNKKKNFHKMEEKVLKKILKHSKFEQELISSDLGFELALVNEHSNFYTRIFTSQADSFKRILEYYKELKRSRK